MSTGEKGQRAGEAEGSGLRGQTGHQTRAVHRVATVGPNSKRLLVNFQKAVSVEWRRLHIAKELKGRFRKQS